MHKSGYKLSKKKWNIFITSIHGLVYFHQNTKQVFKEFPKTKDAISLKQHQQFFLECIILINIDDINVLFSDVMDALGPSFSPWNSLCMLMASNKSSNNTGMREVEGILKLFLPLVTSNKSSS
jgi:hypothetical protein